MARPIEIAVCDQEGRERVVDIYDYSARAAAPSRFSSSLGNWLPGDPAEFLVEGARWQDTGKDLTATELQQYGEQLDEKGLDVLSGGSL